MATTKKDTVRLLVKSIVTRLENNKSIAFPVRLRQIIQDEILGLVGPYILTDEDLRERTHAKLGAKTAALADSGTAESDQYKAAKSIVRASFGEDELNGFYFQKSLKHVAREMASYFMRASHIDDVYETDEELERQIVETVQKFKVEDLH